MIPNHFGNSEAGQTLVKILATDPKNEKIVHLKDGRYVYQEKYKHRRTGASFNKTDNDWIVWYWLMSTNTTSNTYYINNKADTTSTFTPPHGYVWVDACGADSGTAAKSSATSRAIAPPTPEEIELPMDIEAEDIITDVYGNPEVDADGNLVDPTEIAMEPESPSEPADNGADSNGGGGDAGGWGDAGGDAGGGGDGGN